MDNAGRPGPCGILKRRVRDVKDAKGHRVLVYDYCTRDVRTGEHFGPFPASAKQFAVNQLLIIANRERNRQVIWNTQRLLARKGMSDADFLAYDEENRRRVAAAMQVPRKLIG